MAEGRPPILPYRSSISDALERPDLLTRITTTGPGLYCIGLCIGAYGTCVAGAMSGPGVRDSMSVWICSFAGILFFLPVLGLPFYIVYWLVRKMLGRMGRRMSIFAGPLATVVFFPAAHLFGCKIVSNSQNDLMYPVKISPFHFLAPWIGTGMILTAILRGSRRLGNRERHWVMAGIAAAPALIANLLGLQFLLWSEYADYPSINRYPLLLTTIIVATIFSIPLLVAMCYESGMTSSLESSL